MKKILIFCAFLYIASLTTSCSYLLRNSDDIFDLILRRADNLTQPLLNLNTDYPSNQSTDKTTQTMKLEYPDTANHIQKITVPDIPSVKDIEKHIPKAGFCESANSKNITHSSSFVKCMHCNGTGKSFNDTCTHCFGTGNVVMAK
jgi:DnaJ-class molecular chaperone